MHANHCILLFLMKGDGEIRTGKYSPEETAAVKNAVEEYCSMKQISIARLCSECDHKAELKGAWMEIAKRLPYRSVQSVYRHGLRQMHPFKRGTWSDEEVEILIGYVAQHGKKWATIQNKLNRSADSCRDKYREFDDSYVRGRWKENETEQLKRLIREYLKADPRADIKELGKMVQAEQIKIPWSVISRRMGKRSRLSCFKKWQKLTGLLPPSDMSQGGEELKQQQQPTSTNSCTGNKFTTSNQKKPDSSTRHKSISNDNKSRNNLNSSNQHRRYQLASTLCSDHHAPTAGAAAANVIAKGLSGGSKINCNSKTGCGVDNEADVGELEDEAGAVVGEQDIDMYILSEISQLGVYRAADVAWETLLRYSDNAQERWYELLDEWQLTVMDDSLLALPVSEIAQLILDRKTSALRAAETVEAVDLPPVPRTLQTRDEYKNVKI